MRPEFVRFDTDGIPVRVVRVRDSGRYRIVETEAESVTIRLLVGEGQQLPRNAAHLRFDPKFTQLYADGWIASLDLYPVDMAPAKQRFAADAAAQHTLVFFPHDRAIAAGYLREQHGKRVVEAA